VNGARSWLFATALGSFAAGTSLGLLIPRVFLEAAPRSEEAEYKQRFSKADSELVSQLVADHGLTAGQARSLKLVMQNQRDQEMALRLDAEELPPATQSRLLKLRYQTTQRIRAILDPQQRAQYDEQSRSGRSVSGPSVLPERGEPSTEKHR
jgi:hypothetical protein